MKYLEADFPPPTLQISMFRKICDDERSLKKSKPK